MLEPRDIEDESGVDDTSIFGVQRLEHVLYPIEMAKLARLRMVSVLSENVADNIVRAIVSTQYLPRQSDTDGISREALHLQLTEWESRLPAEMKLVNQSTPSAIFHTGLLHMTYKYATFFMK